MYVKNSSSVLKYPFAKSYRPDEEMHRYCQCLIRQCYIVEYIVAFSTTLAIFGASIGNGWSSPSLRILQGPNSPIPTTPDEGSWIVAFMMIGVFIGSFPAIYAMDKLGRKQSLLLGVIPSLIGWILIGCATTVSSILIARILIGFTYGCCNIIIPVYLAEISSTNVRGSITVITYIMIKTAILSAFSIAPFVSISTMAWISAGFPIIFFVTYIWCPETPYYLIGQEKRTAASKSLQQLRCDTDVVAELNEITAYVEQSKKTKGFFRDILIDSNRKNTILVASLAALTQLNGAQSIMAYAEIVFERIGSSINPSYLGIILGVVQVTSAIISCTLIDRIGRRPLMMISLGTVTISNTILTVYFIIERIYELQEYGTISTFITILIFIMNSGYTLAMASMPAIMAAELFPKHLKGFGTLTYSLTSSSLSLIVSKLFQIICDNFGYDVMFGIFACFCFIYIPFIWYRLPETKSKSLALIFKENNEPQGGNDNGK